MKKVLLYIGITIIILLVLDVLLLLIINRPLLAVKDANIYKGVWYTAYICPESSSVKLKMKWTKYACGEEKVELKVKEIVDKTKSMKDFACAEALESFYEDEDYIYYYSCIKSSYVVVIYENGYEETVEKALKYGSITLEDLDEYDISYHKELKEL